MSYNKLAEILVANLPQGLKQLLIGENHDISVLPDLKNLGLDVIHLYGTSIEDFSNLKQMITLKILYVPDKFND